MFLTPLVAKIRFEPAWKVAISLLPSPSPEVIDAISVIFRVASLASAGSCPAVISAEAV